jgi:hypothetical protein
MWTFLVFLLLSIHWWGPQIEFLGFSYMLDTWAIVCPSQQATENDWDYKITFHCCLEAHVPWNGVG